MSKQKQLVREQFRSAVFNRDSFKCRVCGKRDELDAHHITNRKEMPNGGYVKENGISLCSNCHIMAEWCLKGNHDETYAPAKLYQLISSSHALAIAASNKL